MPVRLRRAVNGQAANTTYWGADEAQLRANGLADDFLEQASDYQSSARTVPGATANIDGTATIYLMNSASAQTLALPATGFFPVGQVLTVIQIGAGAFTIAPGTGVTVSTALSSLISKGQNNVAQLVKIGASTWVAFGGLGG